jgi:hypothetical protein
MSLSKKQKDDLKSLEKLDSRVRASVNYKIRSKLEDDLDSLEDIEFMLSRLPRDSAKKAVKDKHVDKAMKILLELLDLREFKRVRQNSSGEDGYVIKRSRERYQRTPLNQKDYKRYRAMFYFSLQFKNYFNPRVTLPGETDFMNIGPNPRAFGDWLLIDDDIDYQIHLQQLYGDSEKPTYKMSELDKKRIKEIEKKLFDPAIDQETRMQLASESIHLQNRAVIASMKDIDMPYAESDEDIEQLSQKAIQKNIDATNERIRFFKSTH